MELILNKEHAKIDTMYENIGKLKLLYGRSINYLIDMLSDEDLKFIKPDGYFIENEKKCPIIILREYKNKNAMQSDKWLQELRENEKIIHCAKAILKNTILIELQNVIKQFILNKKDSEDWTSDKIYDYQVFKYLANSELADMNCVGLHHIIGNNLYCFIFPANMQTFWITVRDTEGVIEVKPCFINKRKEFVCVNNITEAINEQIENLRFWL